MNMFRICMLTACTNVLISQSLIADDATFDVPSFIVGIGGQGFIGDGKTEVGESWNFNPDGLSSVFFHDVNDTPLDFEDWVISPLGGSSYGRGQCSVEVTDTQLFIENTAIGFADGGDAGEFAEAYVQVHGEFHLYIDADSTIDYELCNETNGSSTWGRLFIRRLVSNQWVTMTELETFSDAGAECSSGNLQVAPGYYQLYFSTRVNMHNGAENWSLANCTSEAALTITPVPNIADINGDGIVNGADLARVLGAWGTSAAGGDLNGDGIVDGADLAIVLANWT